MRQGKRLNRREAAVLVVDLQEKLYPLVDHPCEILDKSLKLIRGCMLLGLPVIISEQYPKGLGSTIEAIRSLVGQKATYFSKTTFSCLENAALAQAIREKDRSQWILLGIEAHVCIFQTARSLLAENKEVIIANDAISSRSIYDFSSAVAELRDLGARIASTETILFDLMGDSAQPEFKELIELIKS